ncbi:MAG TPA: signal peptidase I [Gaiellaceae bacterium]|nr:signal peptidase I [Gaiellaceae bacterium]
MRRLATAARWTAGLLAGLAVFLSAGFAIATHAFHVQAVAVYSGSMAPRMPVGSLVLERVVPAARVRAGDVITFADPFDRTRVVTHRVVRILPTREGPGYRTKGDANPTRDPWTLKLPPRVPHAVATLPYAGYALVYAQTREVRTALIAFAALTTLVALLRRIWLPRPPKVAQERA